MLGFFSKTQRLLFLSQFYISNISDNNDILRELEKYRYYKPYYKKKDYKITKIVANETKQREDAHN